MSMNFLGRLAASGLPYETRDHGEIEHILILQAAQLVRADVPRQVGDAYEGSATVWELTPDGRTALALAARQKP